MIYLKKGEAFDPAAYLEGVRYAGESTVRKDAEALSAVRISGEVPSDEAGVYTVTYTCEKDGAAGKTVLLVVVEEEKAA